MKSVEEEKEGSTLGGEPRVWGGILLGLGRF